MRKKVSLFLFLCGLLLAILPLTGHRSFKIRPDNLVKQVLDPEVNYSVDEVAKLIVNSDSAIRLIDLRPRNEFIKAGIPGTLVIFV